MNNFIKLNFAVLSGGPWNGVMRPLFSPGSSPPTIWPETRDGQVFNYRYRDPQPWSDGDHTGRYFYDFDDFADPRVQL